MKSKKSILRYPGGKSRAVKHIAPYFDKHDIIVSPFFGGGSIEIHLASLGKTVIGYDVFEPLTIFWKEILKDPNAVADIVQSYLPLSKEDFYDLQKKQHENNDAETAAIFFVLNRCSFSGSTLSGGMSPNHPRFNQNSIDRLRSFNSDTLTVDNISFEDVFVKHQNEMMYLDPPYLLKSGNNLYGNKGSTHKNFNHIKLYELIKDRKKWIMSYNDCKEIRELYEDFMIKTPEWSYGMSSNKSSKEVLIFSPDIEEYIENIDLTLDNPKPLPNDLFE